MHNRSLNNLKCAYYYLKRCLAGDVQKVRIKNAKIANYFSPTFSLLRLGFRTLSFDKKEDRIRVYLMHNFKP